MTLFSGSIHESTPTLAGFASADRMPYLLIDEANKEFLLVFPMEPTPACKSRAGVVSTTVNPSTKQKQWWHGDVCDGYREWTSNVPRSV